MVSPNHIHCQIQFLIVCWCEFGHKDPYQEIKVRLVEMMEKVFLDAMPAICE